MNENNSILNDVERRLLQFAARARVFDFDDPRTWALAKPHLHAPEVQVALDRGMVDCCEDINADPEKAPSLQPEVWRPGDGPWQLSRGDGWVMKAIEALESSGWKHPDDVFDENGDPIDEEAYCEAYEKACDDYYPKPETPDWYRPHGRCHWIAPWCQALGRPLFPELQWVIVESEYHSAAWGFSQDDPAGVLMDVLLTGDARDQGHLVSANEIVGFVLFGETMRAEFRQEDAA